MTHWVQPILDSESSPYVVDQDLQVNLEYPVGLLCFATLPNKPVTQVIFIADMDGKALVAMPKSVWHRKPAQRTMPPAWVTKMTSLETVACKPQSKTEPIEDTTLRLWVGFLNSDVVAEVDVFQDQFDAEYLFDPQLLPFGQALADAANEHFSFFSASEVPLPVPQPGDETEEPVEEEPGSQGVSSRVSQLEALMAGLAMDMQTLLKNQEKSVVPKTGKGPTMSTSTFTSPTSKPKSKRKSALKTGPADATAPHVSFPGLDEGVAKAAIQAGLGEEVMQEMAKLVQRNPKGAKMTDINPIVVGDPLSEEEEELPEEDGSHLDAGSPVEAAILRLTDIVQSLTDDRKKKIQSSRLDSALDVVVTSGTSDSAGIGSGKRSAAARRALRAMLMEHPQEISGMIEKLMHEDMTCQTLGPGVAAPLTSTRGWMEHRSRIGNYRTLAHAAWGVAGALDSLAAGNIASARARLGILMLQFDQSAIDRGSWYLASELSLESPPPFAALEQHRVPNIQDGESPYSKLLDQRWAEVSLAHLKEQEDFLARRKNLGKTKKEDEDADALKIRKAKAKAKARSSNESEA